MTKLRVLSLFAGIGGFDLGLERTGGFRTVAFCEIDKKAQAVLRKHWPGVPIYDDVQTLTKERLVADGIAVDCIVGGFPCQDISFAGKGAGLSGERSGLFFQVARLAGELEPRYIILENVAALLGRGLGDVLGTLASLGFDAEWDCIPAAHVGAPHRRDRIWIVAYRQGDPLGSDANRAGPYRAALHVLGSPELRDEQIRIARSLGEDVADAASERRGEAGQLRCDEPEERTASGGEALAHPCLAGLSVARSQPYGAHREQGRGMPAPGGWWATEPPVGRVANGIPGRVDRLKQLGNAVVPQIPELIGNAILASLTEQRRAAA